MNFRQLLCLVVALAFSVSAHAQANDTSKLVGKWDMTALTANGKPVPKTEFGDVRMVFNKDGSMESWEDGKKDTVGWYEKGANAGEIVAYKDENKNGKLDADEKADPTTMAWSIKAGVLTMTIKEKFGDQEIVIVATFKAGK